MTLYTLFLKTVLFIFLLHTGLADNQLRNYTKTDKSTENNSQNTEEDLQKKDKKPAKQENDFQNFDESKKSEQGKVDLFNPPEFKEPSVVEKTVAKVKAKVQTQTKGIPDISLKALVLKSKSDSMAVLMIDKKEVFVEPNEVFPIVIDDSTWELSVKNISRNGVFIEINYNSIKLLVK